MEELQKKHRLEQRDLQSKITQKRKSATKKTRKAINDECAELERQLDEKQASDLQTFEGQPLTNGKAVVDVHAITGESTANDPNQEDTRSEKLATDSAEIGRLPSDQGRKQNRQKARLARRAAEQEAAAAQAEEEAANLPNLQAQERLIMLNEFEARGLEEINIRSDGHCLYAAVADQLIQHNIDITLGSIASNEPAYKVIRHVAAQYISDHPDEFLPFLEEPLDEYLTKVRDTGEWGGHLELQALGNAYEIEINVLQGNGRVENIHGKQQSVKNVIWLAYYRHSFGLGEHYNSLRQKSPSNGIS